MTKGSNALGRHVLVEYFDCDSESLNDINYIRDAMLTAAEKSGATVVNDVFHLFNPHGVSGVVVIAESHLAIHTWPEYNFAAVDLFTCGTEVDPWIAFEFLKEKFKAGNHVTMEMKRGVLAPNGRNIAYKPVSSVKKDKKMRLPSV
ncbi:MAG: adenosylmethionine decarboxylase [Spirochaetes bacterium]|nr:adenosylmethionine decarboxylase [Spirochaetota bacterium]